VVDFIFVVLQ